MNTEVLNDCLAHVYSFVHSALVTLPARLWGREVAVQDNNLVTGQIITRDHLEQVEEGEYWTDDDEYYNCQPDLAVDCANTSLSYVNETCILSENSKSLQQRRISDNCCLRPRHRHLWSVPSANSRKIVNTNEMAPTRNTCFEPKQKLSYAYPVKTLIHNSVADASIPVKTNQRSSTRSQDDVSNSRRRTRREARRKPTKPKVDVVEKNMADAGVIAQTERYGNFLRLIEKRYGLHFQHSDGDGNCFYKSAAFHIEEVSHSELRQLMHNTALENLTQENMTDAFKRVVALTNGGNTAEDLSIAVNEHWIIEQSNTPTESCWGALELLPLLAFSINMPVACFYLPQNRTLPASRLDRANSDIQIYCYGSDGINTSWDALQLEHKSTIYLVCNGINHFDALVKHKMDMGPGESLMDIDDPDEFLVDAVN